MAILANGRELRTVEEGEVIFQAGDPGDSVCGIVDGRVQITWGEGEQVEILGPGSTFGISALVEPTHRRYGTATALQKTQLLEMNREEFLFALQELPMFGLEMLHALEQRLAHLKRDSP